MVVLITVNKKGKPDTNKIVRTLHIGIYSQTCMYFSVSLTNKYVHECNYLIFLGLTHFQSDISKFQVLL